MHMTDNAVCIKTTVVYKDNPQGLGDLRQIKQIINTGPIGMIGRIHAIISNMEAIAKDGLLKEKEIKSLKKELVAQRRLTRELESAKVPTEELRKVKPLREGMIAVKQEVMDEVLVVLRQFIEALHKISFDEDQLKYIVTKRVRLHRFLESQKPIILRFETR